MHYYEAGHSTGLPLLKYTFLVLMVLFLFNIKCNRVNNTVYISKLVVYNLYHGIVVPSVVFLSFVVRLLAVN